MECSVSKHVLLVGEGDFSLSLSLIEHGHIKGHQMTTTSIESRETICKHHAALNNIKQLKDKGVQVYFEIDARHLLKEPCFDGKSFSRIIFNFPHSGGKSNHKKNRILLNDFFSSATKVLDAEGQIMVTLCKGQGGTPADRPMRAWHDSWQVVSMAANSCLILRKVIPFDAADYQTYNSVGYRSQDKGFNTGGAITHVFEHSESVPIITSFKTSFIHQHHLYSSSHYLHCKLDRNILKDIDHPVTITKSRLIEHLLCQLNSSSVFVSVPCLISCKSDTSNYSKHKYYIFNYLQQADDKIQDLRVVERDFDLKCNIDGENACVDITVDNVCNIGDDESNNKLHIRLRRGLVEQIHDVINSHGEGESCHIAWGLVAAPCTISPHLLPFHHELLLSYPLNSQSSFNKDDFTTAVCNSIRELFPFECFIEDVESTDIEVDINVPVLDKRQLNVKLTNSEIPTLSTQQHTVASIIVLDKHLNVVFHLDNLARLVYALEDPRLLWSTDVRFLQKFKQSKPVSCFKPFSVYPMKFEHDLSFWEAEGEEFDEMTMCDIIREVSGDVVNRIELIDMYVDGKTEQRGRCYRFTFFSSDKTLSYITSWKLQSIVRLEISSRMGIKLR